MKIERFEDIECWKIGRRLAGDVDELARNSGLKGDFGLRDQMSRSSGSIMDNVAEGFDSGTNADFVRFLWYAKRSCTELQSQLYRALDRGYCKAAGFEEIYQTAETAKAKIGGFIAYLQAAPDPRSRKTQRTAQTPCGKTLNSANPER